MTSRAFNGDVARAKRAAAEGPVIITDRGRPAHILPSWDGYARLTGHVISIADLLHHEGAAETLFDLPRLEGRTRPANL